MFCVTRDKNSTTDKCILQVVPEVKHDYLSDAEFTEVSHQTITSECLECTLATMAVVLHSRTF